MDVCVYVVFWLVHLQVDHPLVTRICFCFSKLKMMLLMLDRIKISAIEKSPFHFYCHPSVGHIFTKLKFCNYRFRLMFDGWEPPGSHTRLTLDSAHTTLISWVSSIYCRIKTPTSSHYDCPPPRRAIYTTPSASRWGRNALPWTQSPLTLATRTTQAGREDPTDMGKHQYENNAWI